MKSSQSGQNGLIGLQLEIYMYYLPVTQYFLINIVYRSLKSTIYFFFFTYFENNKIQKWINVYPPEFEYSGNIKTLHFIFHEKYKIYKKTINIKYINVLLFMF